ncbi:nucleotide disphospho-sugar-binding domain-containing protein [Dactylosporangium sp. NPDC049742]|uniref:glycosyltransferase n=1 Tax=Dactylosporangium sp. NPDC049742 TaxID=3154737 RepID=UPI003432373E
MPGAAAAAYRRGIPGLWHGFGRMFPEGIGLRHPARVAEAPGRPHLDICPPSLQDKDFLATAERIPLRPVMYAPPPPRPGFTPPAGALVYLTLGTAFGTAELLTTAINGLAQLGVTVVVATGRVPPHELGALPANVTAEPWVDQAAVLPHAAVVVHHGGSGTTLGALAAGVPQLLLPQGADQHANADAVTAAGAGLRLLPDAVTTDAVADEVLTLLAGRGGHREASRALAHEIAAMPSPAEVARELPRYTASP